MDFTLFGTVESVAFRDDSGVYLNGDKIALDSSRIGGYVRYADGFLNFEPRDECNGIYNVTTPLVFVGHMPGCVESDALYCSIMSMAECNDNITSLTFDKIAIAESEGVALDELTKFEGVLLVRMEYETQETKIYDGSCTIGLC